METLLIQRTGLTLSSPLIAASGTFGYGDEVGEEPDFTGLGAIVCKGTTLLPRTGNPPIRMTETAAGMLNSIGLQNIGIDRVVSEKAPRWARMRIPIFVNVSATSTEEYCEVVSRLNGVKGVSGVELNISCPNVKEYGVMFGSDPIMAGEVTARVKATTELPLIVKLSPNVANIRSVAAAVERAGADAISVMNTLYGMAIDIRRREPVLAGGSGGLSGPAIKPHALYLVYEVAQEVGIPIIGIGGVMSGSDAVELLLAGATAVGLGTVLLVDPTAYRRIAAELAEWCRREGVRSLGQIVGSANSEFKR
jgi:dihydroorotate dehydrogenase (NAD+) catalytic subunit